MITSIPIDVQNRIAHFWSARLEKAAWLLHLGNSRGVGPTLDEIGARILEHHRPQLSAMRSATPSSVLAGVRRAARILYKVRLTIAAP